MSIKNNVYEELKRSPITVIATVAGVVVGALALFVAWLTYVSQSPAQAAPSQGTVLQSASLNLSNLSLSIAFFFAATFASASLIRLLARYHGFSAFVLSIPTAALVAFFSLVVLSLAPPKPMNATAFATARDLVFYGTIVIYVAIHGQAILKDMFANGEPQKSESEAAAIKKTDSTQGGGVFVGIALLLLIWSSLVSSGLSKLATMFLSQ
jgi:hypothetical protein